jgi:membrane associated rhomboid family serine protease
MTVIPFRKPDDTRPPHPPAVNIPPYTLAALGLMVGIHAVLEFLPGDVAAAWIYQLAFVPERFSQNPLSLTAWGPLITHMFLHGSWTHVAMNGVMFLAFGAACERMIGGKKAALLFLLCGMAGALAHYAIGPHNTNPMLGASGALSGLFAATILRLQASGHMPAGRFGIWGVAAIWIGLSVGMAMAGAVIGLGSIAWAAHAGGFLAGIACMRLKLFRV